MPSYRIVREIDEALVNLLKKNVEKVGNRTVNILLSPPVEELIGKQKPALTVYLFGIAENLQYKKYENIVKYGTDVKGEKYEYVQNPPICVNLKYIITPWADSLEDEHLLLANAVLTFHDNSVLELVDGSKPAKEREPETIPIAMVHEISLEEQAALWRSLNQTLKPSVFYQLIVDLESSRIAKVRRVEERVVELVREPEGKKVETKYFDRKK